MGLDRRALSRIDRKLLAGLDEEETYQMVRVPVTPATWSTWRRYCQRAGVSMGRAIMVLIEAELVGELGERLGEGSDLTRRAEEQLAAREAELEGREREVKAAEKRLRRSDQQLRLWHREVDARARSANAESKMVPSTSARTKVGRNDPCPCGSGSKFKWCHGR